MKAITILLLALIRFTLPSRCQDPVAVFTQSADSVPVEHIYLHCNQDYFSAGQTIYFKAYLVSAYNSSQLSANLFAEILNENRKVVTKGRFPVIAGIVTGSIDLPDTLRQGAYLLRAYTPWTMNLGNEYVFNKAITVFNEFNKESVQASVAANNAVFTSQGGALVAGLPNTIGCRSFNQYMQPVKMSGKVVDSKGDEVADFETGESGTSVFNFIPEKGESYTAEVVYADKTRGRIMLQQVLSAGAVIDITTTEEGKYFSAAVSSSYNDDSLLLLATVQNNIVAKTKLPLVNNRVEGLIATQELEPGLMQLLLFDSNGKLLTSAGTIVNASSAATACSIKTDTLSFSPKGRNVWRLVLPDSISGSFSLSITDVTDDALLSSNSNIISGLLLQPGCRSYIDPGIVHTSAKEMENIAAAGEWQAGYSRRSVRFKDEPYIKLRGKVIRDNKNSGAIKDDLNFIIQTKDSSSFFVSTPVLPDDRFELRSLIYEDSAVFYYQLNTRKIAGRDVKIQLDTSLAKLPLPGVDNLEPWFSAGRALLGDPVITAEAKKIQQEYIAAKAHDKTLAEVVVKAKILSKEKQLDKKYTSGLFSGGVGAKMIDVGDDAVISGSRSIFQYLQGKVAGAWIHYDETAHRWVVESRKSFSTSDIVMNGGNGLVDGILFLDEVETDADFIERVPVSEIAYVKFFPPGSLNHPGMGIACGLAVYRKNGSEVKPPPPVYLNSFRYPGYTPVKTFILPDYSYQENKVPDIRTTLYWNPELPLAGKETRIAFYNSDKARKFRVILEGVTSNGQLVHTEKIISK